MVSIGVLKVRLSQYAENQSLCVLRSDYTIRALPDVGCGGELVRSEHVPNLSSSEQFVTVSQAGPSKYHVRNCAKLKVLRQ